MLGILIVTIIALVFGIAIVFIEDKLSSDSDNVSKYEELLPGYNCGGCGYGGCHGMAEAMVEDIDNYKKCKPLRGEALKKMEEFVKSIK